MRTRANTTLTATKHWLRNGRALKLAGSVLGGHIPPNGKAVVLRVRAAGSREWYKAGSARTDADGRWQWRYRFMRTQHRTTYAFKAVVTRDRRYPVARGASAPDRVTVVP